MEGERDGSRKHIKQDTDTLNGKAFHGQIKRTGQNKQELNFY